MNGRKERAERVDRVNWLWAFRNEHPELRLVSPVLSDDERWHVFRDTDAGWVEIPEASQVGNDEGYAALREYLEKKFGVPNVPSGI